MSEYYFLHKAVPNDGNFFLFRVPILYFCISYYVSHIVPCILVTNIIMHTLLDYRVLRAELKGKHSIKLSLLKILIKVAVLKMAFAWLMATSQCSLTTAVLGWQLGL